MKNGATVPFFMHGTLQRLTHNSVTMAKKKKKIFILLGNPDSETYSESLAKAYEEGAKEAGHEVRRVNLGDITFDPILHKGYKVIQELEPDLITIQKNIQWADHFVIV